MIRSAVAMSERELQTAITDAAALFGWMHYHTHDARHSVAGFPDLVLIHPTHGLVFAELKTATGRLSPAQSEWIHALETAGQRVFVWRPVDLDLVLSFLRRGAFPMTEERTR